MSNRYDKMDEYITSIYNVFQMVNKKAELQKDKRLKMIALIIYNYSRFMGKMYNIDLRNIILLEKH